MKHLKLFEEITQYKEGNLKIIYRDNNLTVVVPLTSKSSDITCRGTGWCSRGNNYKNWAKDNILFRFLFKDGYKMRLTWKIVGKEYEFSWGSGGEKYFEIYGPHPFSNIEIMKKNTEYDHNQNIGDDYGEYKTKINLIKKIEMVPEEAKQKIIEYKKNYE